MDVQPDHGEYSFRGIGRLGGKKAIITGGDSESEQDDARETARWVFRRRPSGRHGGR